jgi:5-formyltetrahydrofolate cyclo-ligase
MIKNQSKQIAEKDNKIRELESRIRYLESNNNKGVAAVKSEPVTQPIDNPVVNEAAVVILEVAQEVEIVKEVPKKSKGRVVKKKTVEFTNMVKDFGMLFNILN